MIVCSEVCLGKPGQKHSATLCEADEQLIDAPQRVSPCRGSNEKSRADNGRRGRGTYTQDKRKNCLWLTAEAPGCPGGLSVPGGA